MNSANTHHWPDDLGQEFHDLKELSLNIDIQTGDLLGSWGNLGYWFRADGSAIESYSEAAQQLAQQLAIFSQLQPKHNVLDVGFGCGDQLIYWQQACSVKSIWGMNLSQIQTHYAENKLSMFDCDAIIKQGNACDADAWHELPKTFDRIFALDCIYHFSNKSLFFNLCSARLQQEADSIIDNELVVSDLVLSKPIEGYLKTLILKIICYLSHIPFENLKTRSEYEAQLNQAGLMLLEHRDVTSAVMQPFADWVFQYKKEVKSNKQKTSYKHTMKWPKYIGTALFLRWAARHDIFQYSLMRIGIQKP